MFESRKNTKWRHKKTGNIYTVIYDEATECTNGREDIDYIVYTNGNKIFVRQANEFYTKFEAEKMNNKDGLRLVNGRG